MFEISNSSSTITKKKLNCEGCNGTCAPGFDLGANKPKCDKSGCSEGQSCTESWTDVTNFVNNYLSNGIYVLNSIGYPPIVEVSNF